MNHGENKNGMQCSEFDLLLTDAIDGQLTGEQKARFELHKSSCELCSAMFADVSNGLNWLSELEDREPPRNLVHNIMVATTGLAVTEAIARKTEQQNLPLWQRLQSTLWPVFAPLMTARFGMSAAMAFFSVSLALNVGGIKLKDIQRLDLTPKGISRSYYATEAKAVKYYENIRLVYEIEARVKDLRRAAGSDQQNESAPQKKTDENNKTKENEPERQEQNYSRRSDELIEANLVYVEVGNSARQRRFL